MIKNFIKEWNELAQSQDVPVEIRASFNSYYQELMQIANDSVMTFEEKKKQISLLEEKYTEKIIVDGTESNK
tara:strand:- start:217 stop:432 length:216 start_codon:yes stop_codon:yes gene_type:complete